jgi:CheY-like chemotaxis protein
VSGAIAELAGLRVLVLEDEMMVAMMLEDMLGDLGCRPVGPAASVVEALDLARTLPLDAALLDVNLSYGETGYPVADALAARGVPFAFVTGYGAEAIHPDHRSRPTLQKPFLPAALATMLRRLRTV